MKRLNALTKRLAKQSGMLERYDSLIQDQLAQCTVERVESEAKEREFDIPHKPVIRETAESTKLRIVYDASARASEKAPSLNECLEIGPPTQNQLWSVLVRNRFHPVAISGDLKQAFLQVRVWEPDRDVKRFHWYKDLKTREIEALRFTQALFGLTPSPFLLGGVLRGTSRALSGTVSSRSGRNPPKSIRRRPHYWWTDRSRDAALERICADNLQ